MILHSDQGCVYASKAYNELLPMYGITRSMSPAGTPTDYAVMKAINDWIKAELFMDLHVTGDRPVEQEIHDYTLFFNEQRPAYSLNYLTPKQYRESFSSMDIVFLRIISRTFFEFSYPIFVGQCSLFNNYTSPHIQFLYCIWGH